VNCDLCGRIINDPNNRMMVVFAGRERNLHKSCYRQERREVSRGQRVRPKGP